MSLELKCVLPPYTHTNILTHAHTHTHTPQYAHIHTHTGTHTHTRTYTPTCTHAHIHTHTYAHTHMVLHSILWTVAGKSLEAMRYMSYVHPLRLCNP